MKWGLVLLSFVVASVAAGEVSADFYVSTNGNDAWSGTLDVPNTGGTDGPFATLARARDAVRDLVQAGLDHSVSVFVREGTYYVPETLDLGSEDSGTADYSVTYGAYADEEVWIIGGVVLSGWLPFRDDIWVASIPEGVEPQQVFENGRRMTLARAPNRGYYRVEEADSADDHTEFTYEDGDLAPDNWDVAGATVYIWPTYDWSSHEVSIEAIDADSRTILLESRTGAKPGNRYFVQNILGLLDEDGECRIDRESRLVYCRPRQAPVQEQTMVASGASPLLAIRGAEGPVRNVHFENLNLSVANGHVVHMNNVEDCSIRGCLVENGRSDGVVVTGHAAGVAICDNLVRYHGMNGVDLSGLGPGPAAGGREWQVSIENNHIHHCGRLFGHGAGVAITQSGHNRVAQNDIHHMKRYGTALTGGSWGNATWEEHWDRLHARNKRSRVQSRAPREPRHAGHRRHGVLPRRALQRI